MNNRPLVLLVGKSGSGKTTVAEYLQKIYSFRQLESYTTRNPRYDGEKGHTFISYGEYLKLPNKVAHTYFNGHYYCATQEQCDVSDIYVVDPDGVKTFKQNYRGNRKYIIVYLKVSVWERFVRMLKRQDKVTKAVSRVLHDYKKFGDFENNDDVHVIKNKMVWEAARDILGVMARQMSDGGENE